MNADPLDTLLHRLSSGDATAAEQVFVTYEPYLRMVIRRHLSPDLRVKFDSLDIVQSVWVHVLRGFRESGWRFADRRHFHAFLVQLTRHRFIDRVRSNRRALDREQPLMEAGSEEALADDPQPLDVLQANELWEQLIELCPPDHLEILRLKREGALTAEVAARTGLHEGSVRRILNALARRLTRRQASDGPDSRGTL